MAKRIGRELREKIENPLIFNATGRPQQIRFTVRARLATIDASDFKLRHYQGGRVVGEAGDRPGQSGEEVRDKRLKC